jgi:hypothetical protein
MMHRLAMTLLVTSVCVCCGSGRRMPKEDRTVDEHDGSMAAAGDAAAQVPWTRIEVAGAGIAIDHHPDWSMEHEERAFLQWFSTSGVIMVRWGADATIEHILATLAIDPGSTRRIEADGPATVDGIAARRVRIRVSPPNARPVAPVGAPSMGPMDDYLFVYLGFNVGVQPVLIGYRSPGAELNQIEPLAEHVLANVRVLRRD